MESFGTCPKPFYQNMGPPVLKLHVESILVFEPEILLRSGDALKKQTPVDDPHVRSNTSFRALTPPILKQAQYFVIPNLFIPLSPSPFGEQNPIYETTNAYVRVTDVSDWESSS